MRDINEKNREMGQQQADLEKNLSEIAKARALEERQNWLTRGIADISDILRQDNKDIHSTLITSIVKYIDATQGSIFMVNENDSDHEFLEMVACYAYERKKHFSKKIEIGQGLIGQCYLEKETIRLKEVPEDFVNITSGLGEAVPTFVAIIPIRRETSVTGVMEFALFHELEDYQIEFLEKLGQNIATFFIENTMNTKTKELLEQTQSQMEELRAQEEEMRQNMEEMHATHEELLRKEQQYVERIEELEKETSQSPS
jgi:vacuolar-type H+-ATPase subunit I/STV1